MGCLTMKSIAKMKKDGPFLMWNMLQGMFKMAVVLVLLKLLGERPYSHRVSE